MPLYPFGPNDVFRNRVKTYPKSDFWIWNRKIFYNNQAIDVGAFHSQSLHIPLGHVSLYEMNVDRNQDAAGQMIYPFITKESGISAFKTVSTNDFNSGYLYGEEIAGKYPLSAAIHIESYRDDPNFYDIKSDLTVGRPHLLALRNICDSYKYLSPHYAYSSSTGLGWNKGEQEAALVSIPSIFFGSSIRKGSVSLKFYITGTLAAELQDINKNGDLIQVAGSANELGSTYGSGSVAGVVLYNEGFVILTGSWDVDPAHTEYYNSNADTNPRWTYFGTSADPKPFGYERVVPAQVNDSTAKSAWHMSFEGINYIPALTMFAHAPKGWLNHSNNPTFKEHGQKTYTDTAFSSSFQYSEPDNVGVKNTVSSSWEVLTASYNSDYQQNSASFKRQTFISKVGIYDEQKNLIAVAKLAKPIKKTEEDDFTFKLKLDF
jgi:hypothetical protein